MTNLTLSKNLISLAESSMGVLPPDDVLDAVSKWASKEGKSFTDTFKGIDKDGDKISATVKNLDLNDLNKYPEAVRWKKGLKKDSWWCMVRAGEIASKGEKGIYANSKGPGMVYLGFDKSGYTGLFVRMDTSTQEPPIL